ncbi:MAG: NAD(P)/FAD-dependent oxidoreductase [Chloroflexota bacterium]|nr:NAD(P)/FAD-dependent oxidoreductase [Chloroflexota bacterium]
MAVDIDVAVVGGGHNGLVAATYLAWAGLKVHVFERRSWTGGAAITEELWPGFKFSTCAHMVHGIQPKIYREFQLLERGMEVIPRQGIQIMPDGTYFGPKTHDSSRNCAVHLTQAEQEGQRRYGEFKNTLQRAISPYRLQPPPSLDEVRATIAGTPAADVLEKALTTRIYDLQDELLPDGKLKDRLAYEAGAIGRNPFAFQFAYASLNAVDEETGIKPPNGYVRGGVGVISRLFREFAEEAGVTIQTEHEVEEFLVEKGEVVGIRLGSGDEVRSRVVASNIDPKGTFLRLMSAEHLDSGFRKRIQGMITNVSCYKFLAVISELPQWSAWDGDPELPSKGAVVISLDRAEMSANYDDLEAGRPPRRPLISYSIPSAVDDSLTQPGYHTASIWIYPAPAKLQGTTWDAVREQVAEGLIDQITDYAPNFRRSIRDYKLRTPLDLERENGLTDGCIWHVQHTGEHLVWNRPLPEISQYRAPLPGLYLCGAGQHPGGEISGVPGHNAAHEILKDLGQV